MNKNPIKEGFLPEHDGHKIYYVQYGNPKGDTILSLHGGPGSKSKPKHIKNYNLDKFQVIAFDQRGCGQSLPTGELKENTTQKLIEDIERLRLHLNIDTWFIAGGSWGSTLALLYAEAYPKKVKGLLLSSVFLAREHDIEWSFSKAGGIERIFPDVWEERIQFLKRYNATPHNAAAVLLKKIEDSDIEVAKEIAVGVINWESNLFSTVDDVSYVTVSDISEDDIAGIKVFLHYELNNFFLQSNEILNNIKNITTIPTIIVHGRYDLLCPIDAVWSLKKELDDIQVIILPSSGHKLTAEGNVARDLVFNSFLKDWGRNSR